MSLDMNKFLADVKKAALEAVLASKPFAFTLGTVTSISPLKVKVDQKLELTKAQLILTNAVRDHTVYMTEGSESNKKAYRVHLALKVGERVLLLRTNGGQKFIILDRVEAPA